jgi:hypothetical protein
MGTPNPRPSKATLSVGDNTITIYAKLNEMAPFLGTITADTVPTVVVSNQSVNGHQRRRYPGGPLVAVASHARRRVIEQALPDQTLPGRNAWLERSTGSGASKVEYVEQITFVGNFQDLKDYCKANSVVQFTLRSPNGAPFSIPPS